MGERWLKAEEAVILTHYPTARRWKILALIPDRTWEEIGAKARKMRVLRTTQSKGDSIREGRKSHKDAWSDLQNERFDRLYPIVTREELLAAFPNRTFVSIQSHAQKRHIYRSREATGRQMNIGREEAKRI
jgi:hypothetical protein